MRPTAIALALTVLSATVASTPSAQTARDSGLPGHSEGAIVGVVAAAISPDINFIIWMAKSAVSGGEILRRQAASLALAAGAAPLDLLAGCRSRLMTWI